MKKFTFVLVGLIMLVLTACSRTTSTAVVNFGFEVHFSQYIDQGVHAFTRAGLQEILPAFSYYDPVMNFTFSLELVGSEVKGLSEAEVMVEIGNQTVNVEVGRTGSSSYVADFEEITFTQPGVYTFRIAQLIDDITNWQLDQREFYLVVTVTEHNDGSELFAEVSEQTVAFTNQLIQYIGGDLDSIFEYEHHQQLAVMHDELAVLLQDLVNQNLHGGVAIGISYLCLRTGRQIDVNGDQLFQAQSTVKLAAHMMVAEAVNAGELAWDQMITITEADMLGAEHGSILYIWGDRPGHQRSLYDFMRYSITHSDNIGFTVVMRRAVPGAEHFGMDFTNAYFNRFLSGELPTGRHRMSANQQARILQALYHGLGVVDGFDTITYYMMNTVHHNRLVTNQTRGYVAHIPGRWHPYREYYCEEECYYRGLEYGENRYSDPIEFYFHDSGIFFTDNPYILVIYTRGMTGIPFVSQVSDAVFTLVTSFGIN